MTEELKPFFISDYSYQRAIDKAKELNIMDKKWFYVPMNHKFRFEKIAGHHYIPEKNLIGTFSPMEIQYLTS